MAIENPKKFQFFFFFFNFAVRWNITSKNKRGREFLIHSIHLSYSLDEVPPKCNFIFIFFAMSQFDWPITQNNEIMAAPQNKKVQFWNIEFLLFGPPI